MVAMVNLSGTAGPISIKCGQAGAELRRLMPTQTDRKERLLRHAGWVDGGERRREGERERQERTERGERGGEIEERREGEEEESRGEVKDIMMRGRHMKRSQGRNMSKPGWSDKQNKIQTVTLMNIQVSSAGTITDK